MIETVNGYTRRELLAYPAPFTAAKLGELYVLVHVHVLNHAFLPPTGLWFRTNALPNFSTRFDARRSGTVAGSTCSSSRRKSACPGLVVRVVDGATSTSGRDFRTLFS